MAVTRGGVAFWVGCVRNHSSRQPIQTRSGFRQVVEWRWRRPLSSAVWALAPPNSLRYQNLRLPVLSHPLHHASRPQRRCSLEEDWQDSLSVCVLVRQGGSSGLRTLLEIPLFADSKPGPNPEFCFPLTTVDGSREDDINVESFGGPGAEAARREPGCFRSLFQAEGCPAPYMYGSTFYCFHSAAGPWQPGSQLTLSREPGPPPQLAPGALCQQATEDWPRTERQSEEEEKLNIMYERLRAELPAFFVSTHDYSMYCSEVEFINGIINVRTRGRVVYQLSVSMWRLLCLCYYAEARLDVLKLTKHPEDGTVRARWRIKGLPFHSLLLRFYRKDKTHLYRSYDAFSTFYIGDDGLIHCHKVEKVMPAQPPVLPRVTSLLAGALVALGVQEHRPALNLLPLLLSSLRQSRD